MSRIDINGATVEYADTGTGEPLVLVHGSASDRRSWQLQEPAFAERFRVLSYSRRYHWPNRPIPDGVRYTMDQQEEDLRALVRSLDASPAHLVGHSYGGFLCLLLAIREPSLVRSLVLGEPPVLTLFLSNAPRPLELLRLLATRPRTAAALMRFGAAGIQPARKAFRQGDLEGGVRIFGDAIFGPGGYDRLPGARKAQIRDNLSNIRAELLGPGFLPLRAEEVRSVQVPTLLVTGGKSVNVFHRLTDGLAELLPHCERVDIAGTTHNMHEENAAAYNAAVLSFLGSAVGT